MTEPTREELAMAAIRLAEENIALRCMLSAGCDANDDGQHSCVKGASGEFCLQCGEMTRNGKSKPWFSEERLERTMSRLSTHLKGQSHE